MIIPTARSVIALYPAPCGAAAPAVPAARYCKRSFGFARLSRFRSPRSVRMPRFSIGAQARYPCALPSFWLPSAPVRHTLSMKNAPADFRQEHKNKTFGLSELRCLQIAFLDFAVPIHKNIFGTNITIGRAYFVISILRI